MPNTIRLRRGTTTPTAGSFVDGEPAWDSGNSKLYVKNTAGSMVQIGDAVLSANNAFTGANTYYNATGQTFGTATATNDGIVLQGRAGGTSSFRSTLIPGTLTASRTLTLPDVSGTVITTGDSGTITGSMIAAGTITDGDINASAAIAGTKISPDFGSQNIVTTGTITGDLTPSAGTATVPPIKFTSGTNLSTAAAGAVEYDGTHFYSTPTTTSGRGQIPAWQTFRLTADGTNIGTTIADYYGATSAINLAATSVYDIEFWTYCTKNTAGTITWTLAASSAPVVISGAYVGSLVAGVANSGTPTTGYAGNRNGLNAAFAATASIGNNTTVAFSFKVQVLTNLATTFKLRVTCGAGTVTPLTGSFYTVRQVAGTTGSFA